MLQQLVLLSMLVAVLMCRKCHNIKENNYGQKSADSDIITPVIKILTCSGDSEYCITLYYTFEEPQKRTTIIWDCDDSDVCSDLAKSNPPKDGNGTFTDFSVSRNGGTATRLVKCCKQDLCNNPNVDNMSPYM